MKLTVIILLLKSMCDNASEKWVCTPMSVFRWLQGHVWRSTCWRAWLDHFVSRDVSRAAVNFWDNRRLLRLRSLIRLWMFLRTVLNFGENQIVYGSWVLCLSLRFSSTECDDVCITYRTQLYNQYVPFTSKNRFCIVFLFYVKKFHYSAIRRHVQIVTIRTYEYIADFHVQHCVIIGQVDRGLFRCSLLRYTFDQT